MPSFLDGYNASVLAIPAYLIRMYKLSSERSRSIGSLT